MTDKNGRPIKRGCTVRFTDPLDNKSKTAAVGELDESNGMVIVPSDRGLQQFHCEQVEVTQRKSERKEVTKPR
jgi:hypothetical protein